MHINSVGGLVHGASNSHTLTSYVCVKMVMEKLHFKDVFFMLDCHLILIKLHQARKTMEVCNLKYGLLVMVGVSQCVCVCVCVFLS